MEKNKITDIIEKTLLGVTLSACLAAIVHFSWPRTMENAIVINKGHYTGTSIDCSYLVESCTWEKFSQTKINVDNYDKCLRGSADLSPLNIGDKVNIKYRPGIIGPCDYVMEYQIIFKGNTKK